MCFPCVFQLNKIFCYFAECKAKCCGSECGNADQASGAGPGLYVGVGLGIVVIIIVVTLIVVFILRPAEKNDMYLTTIAPENNFPHFGNSEGTTNPHYRLPEDDINDHYDLPNELYP